jgi:tetratricopeptide (TPR) repeat protein
LGEAKIAMRVSKFDEALAKYQEILVQNPKSPDAHAGIIRAYLKKKDVAHASESATAALAVSDNHTVRTAVAEVYFRQGRISEAEQEWVNVINSGYPDGRAYLGLSRVKGTIANYKTEKDLIDKAYQFDPKDPEIQRAWLGTLPASERIRLLEAFLAGPTGEDPREREDEQRHLDYLKARTALPKGSCRLASKITNTETPLVRLLADSNHLRGYGLTVVVNGRKTNLLLDTGAGGILINRSAAQKAGVTRLSDARVAGIGDKGSKHGYLAFADSIKIGALEFQNCTVEVSDSRSIADEQGLIGANVFSSFLVDIDFPDEKLKLSELPKRPEDHLSSLTLETEAPEDDDDDSLDSGKAQKADAKVPVSPPPKPPRFYNSYIAPEMKNYTRIFRFGHLLLVPTKVADAPLAKLFVLDSGGFSNLISLAAAKEVTKVHSDSDIRVSGISGEVKNVYRAEKATLQFGRLRQDNEDLVSFDLTPLSNDAGVEISGILGFAMLRLLDVKIDYRDGLVDFTYDAQRWEH